MGCIAGQHRGQHPDRVRGEAAGWGEKKDRTKNGSKKEKKKGFERVKISRKGSLAARKKGNYIPFFWNPFLSPKQGFFLPLYSIYLCKNDADIQIPQKARKQEEQAG